MSSRDDLFSVRGFLRDRRALLVHFSTPMTRHAHLFPNDLRTAMGLRDVPISFSTILTTDIGPHQPGMAMDSVNSGGSIGIVVDIADDESVVTVGPSDDGTHFDETTGRWQSGGSPPSTIACARSIDERATINEWFVMNYATVGMFVFCPIMVRQSVTLDSLRTHAENEIHLDDALRHFPNERFFSAERGRFLEFDREARMWLPVEYDAIIPP